VYELTAWGLELEPVVLALGRWGSRAAMPATDMDLGVDAVVIALKTLFDPARAGTRPVTVGLRLGEQEFVLRVGDGHLQVARERPSDVEATIEADPPELAAVLWHAAAPDGRLQIGGDLSAAEFFLSLFPPPTPAAGSPSQP
jgi:hypothetical protein